jgi:hypothetical protein
VATRTAFALILIATLVGNVGDHTGGESALPRGKLRQRLKEGRIASSPSATFRAHGTDGFFEVIGAVYCADRILIAQRSTGTVHVFDRSGRQLEVTGRLGSGPGEYQRMTLLQRTRSGVMTYDVALNRYSHISCNGRIDSSRTLVRNGSQLLGIGNDERLVFAAPVREPPVQQPSVRRTRFNVLVSARQTQRMDSIAVFRGAAMYREPFGRGGERMLPQVLGAQGAAVIDGRSLAVVDGEQDSLSLVTLAEGGVITVSLPWKRAGRISSVEVGAARAARLSAMASASPAMRELVARMPAPLRAPSLGWYGRHTIAPIRAMKSGDFWMTALGGVDGNPPSWALLRPNGQWFATVSAPEELEVLDATEDEVVVRVWDRDDVERIELRALIWAR